MPGTMHAVVLTAAGAPSGLALAEMPIPIPAHDEVLLKVAGCGIGYHDVLVRKGHIPFAIGGVLGGEISGEIVALGSDVAGFAIGDRVCSKVFISCGRCFYCIRGDETHCEKAVHTQGGYAEFCVLPIEPLVKVPAEIPLETSCIFGAAIATALSAVREVGHCSAGEDVLITGGGGGVGIHAIQFARLAGARVIALTTAPAKVPMLREAGAHDVLTVGDGQEWSDSVRALTHGRGVKLVIDCVGVPVLQQSIASLAVKGRLIFVGDVTWDTFPMSPIAAITRALTFVGNHSFAKYLVEDVVRFVADGRIRPYLTTTAPLDRVAWLHEQVEQGRVTGRAAVLPQVGRTRA